MGRQVNFYMTTSDEADFIQFVRSDRDVGIFMYALPTDEIPLLDTLPSPGEPFWCSLWLWDRENSPPPKTDYVPEQHYYVADRFASEIIEFSRCCIDADCLVRGRIWAEMVGWRLEEPGRTFPKSESFRRWFDRLSNWIKRRSIRNRVGDYLLPGAAEYKRKGGRLAQMVFDTGERRIMEEGERE
jgi:hypothetical protein